MPGKSSSADTIKTKVLISYPEYQKLQQYLGCKNTDVRLVCIEQDKGTAENEVSTQIFNKSFNVDNDASASAAVECGSEKATLESTSPTEDLETAETNGINVRPLISKVPDSYREKAKKLLSAFNLEEYNGGVISIDNSTYTYSVLVDIMNKLYGKKRFGARDLPLDSRTVSFLNSIASRKGLKKLIKNKKIFRIGKDGAVKNSDWWKFAE